MKNIRQLADEIGVSKQAIHQKIKKQPLLTSLRQFTSTVDGVVYIDWQGEILIKQAFKGIQEKHEKAIHLSINDYKLTEAIDDSVDGNGDKLLQNRGFAELPSTGTVNNPSMHDDAQIVSILHEQLRIKDKQIEELNARLKETTAVLEHTAASLNAAQALHAGTMQTQLLTDNTLEEEPDKKTFWQRVFRKN